MLSLPSQAPICTWIFWPTKGMAVTEDSAQTAVEVNLEFIGHCFSHFPSFFFFFFKSLRGFCFQVDVQYSQLGGFSHLYRASNFLENQIGSLHLACVLALISASVQLPPCVDPLPGLVKEQISSRGPRRWPSGKASASRAEDPGFESHSRRDFFGVKSYQ